MAPQWFVSAVCVKVVLGHSTGKKNENKSEKKFQVDSLMLRGSPVFVRNEIFIISLKEVIKVYTLMVIWLGVYLTPLNFKYT